MNSTTDLWCASSLSNRGPFGPKGRYLNFTTLQRLKYDGNAARLESVFQEVKVSAFVIEALLALEERLFRERSRFPSGVGRAEEM